MLGYLSPEGIMYTCGYYGHLSLSEKLCKEYGFNYTHKVNAEETLMRNNFIVFRRGSILHWDCVPGEKYTYQEITDSQKRYINENSEKLDCTQTLCVDDMYRNNKIVCNAIKNLK